MVKRKLKWAPIIFILEMLLLFAMIGFVGYKVYDEFFKASEKESEKPIEEKDKIGEYGYTLKDRDTAYFKNEYETLKKELNQDTIDYKKYAESLTKLFIIDFYTLSNKYTSTDIGGLDYIHPDELENFKLNAGRTMYKGVKSNLYGDRTQELPEVSEVTISSVEDTTYNYKDVAYDAYKVSATWTYIKDLGYEKAGAYIIIKKDKLLFLVSGS